MRFGLLFVKPRSDPPGVHAPSVFLRSLERADAEAGRTERLDPKLGSHYQA